MHGLIDREYSHICFTVPTGYNATHIKKKNKEVHYANPEILDMGTCEIPSSSGNLVKVYDKERCICDLIRDKEKIEMQLYSQALRDYFKSKPNNRKLLRYGKQFGIDDKIRTYMEVLSC